MSRSKNATTCPHPGIGLSCDARGVQGKFAEQGGTQRHDLDETYRVGSKQVGEESAPSHRRKYRCWERGVFPLLRSVSWNGWSEYWRAFRGEHVASCAVADLF